jgi:hypothetical protein
MEQYRIAAAAVTGFLGLCFLVGFFKAFLERLYLALLGLSFIVLAASFLVVGASLAWLKLSLLGLAALLFLGAAYLAVIQTTQQMRLIQERRAGLEREMYEYLEQLRKRNAERGLQDTQDAEEAGPENPGGGDTGRQQ